MKQKRFSVEQIIAKLREAEKLQAQGMTISALVEDGDDPYCCSVRMSVEREPDPTILSCRSSTPPSGLSRTGGHVVKTYRFKVPATGRWITNVHATGRCGSPGGSEQTGWRSFGATAAATPTPSKPPTPTPAATSTATQVASSSPSPSPTAS